MPTNMEQKPMDVVSVDPDKKTRKKKLNEKKLMPRGNKTANEIERLEKKRA